MIVDSLTLTGVLIGASNTAAVVYLPIPAELTGQYELIGADRVSNLAITASDTDYRTFTVYGVDGSTAQATRATTVAGGATVAGTVQALTVTGGANAMFEPGDVIKLEAAETGTGPACNETITCLLAKRR